MTTTDGPRTGNAPTRGGHLAYEVAGDGRPVVLLHGGMLDRRMWQAEADLLAREHLVVRYDARGHGDSSTPDGDWEHHDDLVALLDHLGLTRATLVGLSLGAATAIDAAIAYPDRVEALYLASPGLTGMTFRDPFIVAREAEQAAATHPWNVVAWVDAYLRAWVDGPGRGGPAPTEVRGQCRDMAYMTLVRHAAATGAAHGVGAQRHLSEIACPVETVFGEYDATDVRDMAERLARAVPGTSVHAVDRAGHLVNLDQPARFAQLLTGFLARTTGSAA